MRALESKGAVDFDASPDQHIDLINAVRVAPEKAVSFAEVL
jgi:hypothetical protein